MSETGSGAKMLHTMIRVKDLDKSIEFYTGLLGMELLSRNDYPGGKFTLAVVGYGDASSNAVIELTHNWDQEKAYDLGNGFGHVAIGGPDIYDTCEKLEAAGANIPRPPGAMMHGTTVIAFVDDPDGYKIELIEK